MNESHKLEGYKGRLLDLPKWLLIYLIITVVLYLFGPIDWKTHNPVITFALLFLYFLALGLGFSIGKKIYRPIKWEVSNNSQGNQFILKYFYLISVAFIILKLIAIERIVRLYGWTNMFSIVENIFSGTYSNLYTAEKLVSGGSAMFGGTLFTLVSLFFSPITYCYIPIVFILWKKLSWSKRLVGLVCVTLWAIQQLGSGTSQGFFAIIMPLFVAFLLREPTKKVKSRTKTQFFVLILCIVLLLVAFNFVMADRMKNTVNFSQIGENKITKSGVLYECMPEGYKNLLIWTDFYICQGYYGFSLATTLDWIPTFGAGFSRWLCLELSSAISPQIYQNTYQMRIEENYQWGASANWHTAFSWFANDVSLYGVILVMFFLGLLFVYVYYDAYYYKNPMDVGLLCLLVQMIFFLPCNNMIFSDSFSLVPFFVYLIAFLFRRKGIKIALKPNV